QQIGLRRNRALHDARGAVGALLRMAVLLSGLPAGEEERAQVHRPRRPALHVADLAARGADDKTGMAAVEMACGIGVDAFEPWGGPGVQNTCASRVCPAPSSVATVSSVSAPL